MIDLPIIDLTEQGVWTQTTDWKGQGHELINEILLYHKPVSFNPTAQIKEWSNYYIPANTHSPTDPQLLLVSLRLTGTSTWCIPATEDVLASAPWPPEYNRVWKPQQLWNFYYSTATDINVECQKWGPVFVCMPGATFYTDHYWWADSGTLVWGWGIRLRCDDSFRASPPWTLSQQSSQYSVLPPFVVSNLTG